MIYYELYSVGLHHEGLYRVAGFHDHIEAIRKEFDLGESSAVYVSFNLKLQTYRCNESLANGLSPLLHLACRKSFFVI